LQDPENNNFEEWFDPKKVVSNKRGQIALIIRETFQEKNFPLIIDPTVAAAQNPRPDSYMPKSHLPEPVS
jgi:hypothetical protein